MSSDVQLTKMSLGSITVYVIGISATLLIYYRLLRLNTLTKYSGLYAMILIAMVTIMMLNMAYSISNPPSSCDHSRDDETIVVQRSMNVIAFIFISNIMIRDYNRSHTANSKIVQNLIVIITVTLMMNNAILWIPEQDIHTMRLLRDIRTVNFIMGLGFMIIFIIDVVKRGSDVLAPDYL